ncbi:MAG: ZIP family metal transporter [Gemmatimonadales bacterium]
MTPLLYAAIAVVGNIVGGVVVIRAAKGGLRAIQGSLAFSAGFMIAVALLGMLPHAFEAGGDEAAVWVLIGYLLVHFTQHTLVPHFHFGEETHHVSKGTGYAAMGGLLLHMLFDGVAIASGFAVSTELGFLLFVAILLHKLPEGVTIASIQLASGFDGRTALISAALLGLATVVGVVVHDAVAFLAAHGLALSAGVTIYVAASNLVPEFQHKRGKWLPLIFFIGAGSYFLARMAVQ